LALPEHEQKHEGTVGGASAATEIVGCDGWRENEGEHEDEDEHEDEERRVAA
jgi:hypothetical protein